MPRQRTFAISRRVSVVGGKTPGLSWVSRRRRHLAAHPGGIRLRGHRHIARGPRVLDCPLDRLGDHLRWGSVALDDATGVIATAVLPLDADDDGDTDQASAKHKHNGGTRLEEIIGGIQCETSDKQDATEARENDDSNHLCDGVDHAAAVE